MALLSLQSGVARTVVESLHLAHRRLRRIRLAQIQTQRSVHELHLDLLQLLAQIPVDDMAILVHTLLALHDARGVHHLVQCRPVLHSEVVHGLQQQIALLLPITLPPRHYDDHRRHDGLDSAADHAVEHLQQRVDHVRHAVVLHRQLQIRQLQIGMLDLQLRLLVHHSKLERQTEHGLHISRSRDPHLASAAVQSELALVLGEVALVDLALDLFDLQLQVANTHSQLRSVEFPAVQNESHQHYDQSSDRTPPSEDLSLNPERSMLLMRYRVSPNFPFSTGTSMDGMYYT